MTSELSSTIPPYLCAEWSIDQSTDQSGVSGMVHGVVMQEMGHFGMVCNMLTAIGGTPQIASADLVPTYPTTNGLPGGIQPGLVVDLLPLSKQSLYTFMGIEFPETDALGGAPHSIGAYYDTIWEGFKTGETRERSYREYPLSAIVFRRHRQPPAEPWAV